MKRQEVIIDFDEPHTEHPYNISCFDRVLRYYTRYDNSNASFFGISKDKYQEICLRHSGAVYGLKPSDRYDVTRFKTKDDAQAAIDEFDPFLIMRKLAE